MTTESSDVFSVTNTSGGVNLDAGHDVNIGGDVVGRDKITIINYVTQFGSPDVTSQSFPDTALQIRWDALRYGAARFLLKALALLDKDEWIPCSQVALLTAIYYPHLFDALERR